MIKTASFSVIRGEKSAKRLTPACFFLLSGISFRCRVSLGVVWVITVSMTVNKETPRQQGPVIVSRDESPLCVVKRVCLYDFMTSSWSVKSSLKKKKDPRAIWNQFIFFHSVFCILSSSFFSGKFQNIVLIDTHL